MRGRSAPAVTLFLAFLLLPLAAWAGETWYVRAAGTELKDAPTAGAKTTKKLAIGTKLELVEKQGAWAKVKVKDDTGFVFGPKISKEKPGKERFGGGTNVASASEQDTAQALRGLSPTAEKAAGRLDITPDEVAAVKKMENVKIPPEELDAFEKEGKLGEYVQ